MQAQRVVGHSRHRRESGWLHGLAPEQVGLEVNSRREAGLTTLEWLLVVAAVAGLSALAVVLVQNVVGGTAESVASHSARQEAAELMVAELTQRWQAAVPTKHNVDEINRTFVSRCRQVDVLFADISLRSHPRPGRVAPGTMSGWDTDPKWLPTCEIA